MASKLAMLMNELTTLESSISKTASKTASPDDKFVSLLDKLAAELDPNAVATDKDGEHGPDCQCDECKKKREEKASKENSESPEKCSSKKTNATKEASMNETQLINRITNQVMRNLEKIAVQGGEVSPTGMDDANTASSSSPLIDAMREIGTSTQTDVESIGDTTNPNDNDLIEGQAPAARDGVVGGGSVAPLQKGACVYYTQEEAQVLNKLASVGYQHIVDVMSDEVVNEKIAEAVLAEQAAAAPQKIARALINQGRGQNVPQNTQTTTKTSARQKLAAAAQQDPSVHAALQVLYDRGLL